MRRLTSSVLFVAAIVFALAALRLFFFAPNLHVFLIANCTISAVLFATAFVAMGGRKGLSLVSVLSCVAAGMLSYYLLAITGSPTRGSLVKHRAVAAAMQLESNGCIPDSNGQVEMLSNEGDSKRFRIWIGEQRRGDPVSLEEYLMAVATPVHQLQKKIADVAMANSSFYYDVTIDCSKK